MRDIFSHGIRGHISGLTNRSYLRIHPHFTEYKRNTLKRCGPGGKRGKITTFSQKARRRTVQLFGQIHDYPSVWQDFTFPDDVMEGKTIEQRARYSSRCIKEFKRKVEREFPDLWGIFRGEWESRKSGVIKGQECPHFHALYELRFILKVIGGYQIEKWHRST